MTGRVPLALCLASVALFANHGTALGAQYFVDGATGDDTNTCLQAGAGAPPLGPCDTIGQGLALALANPGADQVLVADGTYVETVAVGGGTTLGALEATDPKPVIDNSTLAAASAVTINATGGSLQGLEIRSATRPLLISGPGAVTGNAFPTTTSPTSTNDVFIGAVTGVLEISGNEFTDDGISSATGIFSQAIAATNLTISGNDFSGLGTAIWMQDNPNSPVISNNEITGLHDGGAGILVYEGSPTITGNTINTVGTGTAIGIDLSETNGPAGAALSRNAIFGLTNGFVTSDTSLPLTLTGDLMVGNSNFGINSVDLAGGGDGDFTATNLTLFGNAFGDLRVQDNMATLDSTIVGAPIAKVGTATCSIAFSRGPATGTPGDLTDCNDFQTTDSPLFNDFHLTAASTLIDAGNPAAPAPGSLDIDGNARALDGSPACSGNVDRRDMGADEFVPQPPTSCDSGFTPVVPVGPAAPPQPVTKQCKAKRKPKGKVAAAAKCKKRRKKK